MEEAVAVAMVVARAVMAHGVVGADTAHGVVDFKELPYLWMLISLFLIFSTSFIYS